jgi:DNA adenine methylase
VIRRYDSPKYLFYLDLPHWGCEADYGDRFGRDDFAAMADQLSAIRGRFILSINDTSGAREVFGRFAVEAVATTYSVSAAGQTRVGELIVTGRARP